MQFKFTKMHGIGNDFVVLDGFAHPVELTQKQIQYIAHRHFGIGCDQVLLLTPAKDRSVDARYQIFNADGSRAMQCGNGARCVAIYLRAHGLLQKDEIIVDTDQGQLILKINANNDVTVNMGVPSFLPTTIPLCVDGQASLYRLELGGEIIEFGALSMGNPHAVIKVDDVDKAEVQRIGTILQNHAFFPDSVNVGFLQIIHHRAFKLRVYERGSGETLACGSGACAAMVFACQQGYLEEGPVDVELKGGHLSLLWHGEGQPVYMSGSATAVFEGMIEL